MKLSTEMKALRKSMYDAGKNDTEIAAVIGTPRRSVTRWREYNNLPSHCGIKKRFTREEIKTREVLYSAGLTDDEIAEATGCDKRVIRSWRNYHKLPSNPDKTLLTNNLNTPEGNSNQPVEVQPQENSIQPVEVQPQAQLKVYADIEVILSMIGPDADENVKHAASGLVRQMFMAHADNFLFPSDEEKKPGGLGTPAGERNLL